MGLINGIRTRTANFLGTVQTPSNLSSNAFNGCFAVVLSTSSIWIFNNGGWANSGSSGGSSGSLNLPSGQIFVGNASNIATPVTPFGDVTISNSGEITVKVNAITGNKIAANTITGSNIQAGGINSANLATNIALTGSPTSTTQTLGDNSNKIATTSYVDLSIASKQNLVSGLITTGNIATLNTSGQVISSDVKISNDVNLLNNSDFNISTQKAVKTYVDTKTANSSNYLGAFNNSSSLPSIAVNGNFAINLETSSIWIFNNGGWANSGNVSSVLWENISGSIANNTALQNALNLKEEKILFGTVNQYFRGDKTFQNLNSTAVGLSNVTNEAQLKRSSNDFRSFTEKTSPTSLDVLLIEDATNGYSKAYTTIGNINIDGGNF